MHIHNPDAQNKFLFRAICSKENLASVVQLWCQHQGLHDGQKHTDEEAI
jgi:hypothetical protein